MSSTKTTKSEHEVAAADEALHAVAGVLPPQKIARYQAQNIDVLKRSSDGDLKALAQSLANCTPEHRCGLLLCQTCRRDRQVQCLAEHAYPLWVVREKIGEDRWSKHAKMVSIIFPKLLLSAKELLKTPLPNIASFVTKLFVDRLPRTTFHGPLEVEAVSDEDNNRPTQYVVHFHGILVGPSAGQIRRLLSPALRGAEVKRPVHCRKVRDIGRALAYVYKPYFRRSSRGTADGGRVGQKYGLKPNHLHVISRWLANHSPEEREITLPGAMRTLTNEQRVNMMLKQIELWEGSK